VSWKVNKNNPLYYLEDYRRAVGEVVVGPYSKLTASTEAVLLLEITRDLLRELLDTDLNFEGIRLSARSEVR
jgi:hypothetical protein